MKRFTNIFACALLIVIVLLSAISCDRSTGTENNTSVDDSTSDTENAIPKFSINKENAASFTIIRPNKCGADTISSSSTIFKKLNELGFDVQLKDDWVRNESDVPTDSYEILIGATNRTESREIRDTLKVDDYAISATEKRLVIIGGSDASTKKAVEYFINTYLSNTADSFSFDVGNIFHHVGEYKLSDVSLCGNSISKYDIVIPKKADHITKYAASLISQKLSEVCGYAPYVCEEGNSMKSMHITLSYSESELSEDEYLFRKDGENVSIEAGKRTLLYSVRNFIASLSDISSGTADITPIFGKEKMELTVPTIPSPLAGKTPIGLCDQLNSKAIVIDLSASDPTSKEAILWEWTPSAANGFNGTGLKNRIDELKLRYSDMLGNHVICVTSSSGFMGIAEYPSGKKVWEVNASGYGPHSIDLLPSGLVACALSGNNNTDKGEIRIYACNKDGTISNRYISDSLISAHAVHWDSEFGILWAMGAHEIIAYEISGTLQDPVMTRIEGFGINIGSGGHDFSADPNDNGLFWYSTSSVNIYNKYTNSNVTNFNGRNVISSKSVKCICELPDGRVVRTVATNVYASHNTDTLTVFTPNASGGYDKTDYVFDGRAFYKARTFLLH